MKNDFNYRVLQKYLPYKFIYYQNLFKFFSQILVFWENNFTGTNAQNCWFNKQRWSKEIILNVLEYIHLEL